MKLLKRILLLLLAVLIAVQIPFVYRRYQMGNLASKIAELESQRVRRDHPQYNEYKGIIHAHTFLGGHSTGTFEEIIQAANANDLDFVLMTEHYSDQFDTSAHTLNGVYGKTLFVGGNEIDTADGDRLLMIPGSKDAASMRNMPTAAVIEKLHAENRLALVTYPERFKSWDTAFDGVEVFSLHTAAKQMNPLTALGDLIWTYPSYPGLTLAKNFVRPDANLQKFDDIAGRKREEISPGEIDLTPHLSLFGGTDAHSNIGFHVFGDDAGNKIANTKLDAYLTTLGVFRMHILLFKSEQFNAENLVRTVRFGQMYLGVDSIGDTGGFMLEATENGNWLQGMGGTVKARPGLGIRASAPQNARFIIFKDGAKFFEASGSSVVSTDGSAPGVYRVEVYRDDLGPPFDKIPWIISNPIYVR
ncbi:MAG: hypothetical protein LC734_03975 [Acidobacteria bacterium]|nr:hypothetical protein [Acidobacteriota bacterium]